MADNIDDPDDGAGQRPARVPLKTRVMATISALLFLGFIESFFDGKGLSRESVRVIVLGPIMVLAMCLAAWEAWRRRRKHVAGRPKTPHAARTHR